MSVLLSCTCVFSPPSKNKRGGPPPLMGTDQPTSSALKCLSFPWCPSFHCSALTSHIYVHFWWHKGLFWGVICLFLTDSIGMISKGDPCIDMLYYNTVGWKSEAFWDVIWLFLTDSIGMISEGDPCMDLLYYNTLGYRSEVFWEWFLPVFDRQYWNDI